MSSSETSDDDEESKKIKAALIPSDLLSSLTTSTSTSLSLNELQQSTLTTQKIKCQENNNNICNSKTPSIIEPIIKQGTESLNKKTINKADTFIDVQSLKSKRPDKIFEVDQSAHAYALKTTPEFRNHVGKHLSNFLDKEIDSNLKPSVWKEKNLIKTKEAGIRLFSDAAKLCFGEYLTPKEHMSSTVPQKITARKHRLSSGSSESSEEEKINLCVFSVDDIVHQNQMLINLTKTAVNNEEEIVKEANTKTSQQNEGKVSKEVKKKKKKKAEQNEECVNSSCIEQLDEMRKPTKKKKKKKKKDVDCVS